MGLRWKDGVGVTEMIWKRKKEGMRKWKSENNAKIEQEMG